MCPYYMSIGMTYEQFWDSSPYLVQAFVEADILRKQQQNEMLWIQGMYIYEAFNTVIGNGFGKGKKYKYPDKPYDVFNKTKLEKVQDKQKERDKAIASFDMLKTHFETKQKGK